MRLIVSSGMTALALGLALGGLAGCGKSSKVTSNPAPEPGAVNGATEAAAPAHTASALWSSTRKAEIDDPQYQMTAYTLDIPAGWKYAGTIARPPGCHSPGASIKYTAEAPDGVTAIVFLPGVSWSWSASPAMQRAMEQTHCAGIDIDTAAAFVVNIAVPNVAPGAKIMDVLPLLPEGQAKIAKQLETARQQNAAMAAQYGQPPQKLSSDGARVRVQVMRNGQPVEEMISAVVDCFESPMPAMMGQSAATRRSCSSRGTVVTRAPQGQLDALINSAQFKALAGTMKANPDWQARLTRDQQAAFQQEQARNNAQFQAMMQKGRDDHERLMQNGRDFNAQMQANTDRAMANDRATQNAIDQSAHATALYSLDRQDFKNPATGQTIEASSQYNHQWMSSDGETLIQTNDHAYDPNGQVGAGNTSWTELTPK